MANTTINGKTTKKELIDYLRSTVKDITDGNLKSRIEYALKGLKKDETAVAKSDLYELAKEVAKEVLGLRTPAPVENSPKPKLGKKKTTEEKVEAPVEVEEAESEEEEEAPAPAKKTVKKSSSKKKETPVVESTESGLTKKELPMAKIFPKEIDHEAHGKLVACPDKYHTIQEVREALEEGKTLIFASYWTKRHIKEYGYAQTHGVPVPRAGFPYELDTLQALYVCDSIDRIYALSTYTEAMFAFLADDLVPTECEGNDGEKFLMRYSAGLEYEIYEVVE